MPRVSTVKTQSDNIQLESLTPLHEALAKPDDEQLFYTASLQFLSRRLQEKTHLPVKSRLATQSCCHFTREDPGEEPGASKPLTGPDCNPPRDDKYSLSMRQVLPFPKSNRDGIISQLRKAFRKYRRSIDIVETNNMCDAESSKHISNFKFPRCARRTKDLHPSCLVKISEETSNESVKVSNMKDSVSQGDVL